MQQVLASHRTSPLLFLGIVAAVYTTAVILAGRLPEMERASAVAIGMTLDMIVVVPLAYYLLVVRRRGLPAVALAPVLVLSVIAASWVLPADHQQPLHVLEALVVPVELGLIGWVAWRAARAMRTARRDASAEPIEQFRRAAFELFRNERMAEIFASEIAVFYYAFGAWRARPHVPRGATAFTHHERSGLGGIVVAFLFLLLVEGVVVHVLLAKWSLPVAWLVTIGTIYGGMWLVADYRATVLRPLLVDDESLTIRAGLRYTLDVPRSKIADVGHDRPDLGKTTLSLMLIGEPTHWITLSEVTPARGMYGIRRPVRAVGVAVDDAGRFVNAATI